MINGFRRSHVIRCQEGQQQWLGEITNPGVPERLAGQMGNRKKTNSRRKISGHIICPQSNFGKEKKQG